MWCMYTEISNEYSERCVESNHTHNFWYLYAFILLLISWNLYSTHIQSLKYSSRNNTYDVWLSTTQYANHKISMNSVRYIYIIEGCSAYCSVFFVCVICLFSIDSFTSRRRPKENIIKMCVCICKRYVRKITVV